MKLNTYQLARKELSDMQTKRANMLVKIKGGQEELDLLKDDMIGKDAEGKAVAKYNARKQTVTAMLDVLCEYDRVRLPALASRVNQEKTVVDSAARSYLNEKKCAAVTAVQGLFNKAIKAMDEYSDETVAYSKAEGNPSIPRKLRDINITDFPKTIRIRLRRLS